MSLNIGQQAKSTIIRETTMMTDMLQQLAHDINDKADTELHWVKGPIPQLFKLESCENDGYVYIKLIHTLNECDDDLPEDVRRYFDQATCDFLPSYLPNQICFPLILDDQCSSLDDFYCLRRDFLVESCTNVDELVHDIVHHYTVAVNE
jgi:hypothetical protein